MCMKCQDYVCLSRLLCHFLLTVVTVYFFLVFMWINWMYVGIMFTERFLTWECGNKEIQLYCERLDLVRILHKRSFNFLTLYFRYITVSLENVSGGFEKANSSMICVTNMMLLLLITFYIMMCMLDLLHYVLDDSWCVVPDYVTTFSSLYTCSLSPSVFYICYLMVNKHIYRPL